MAEIKAYNLYTCPTYLSPDVLGTFGSCETLDESLESFVAYTVRMNETAGFGHFPDRALELIRFPKAALQASRVARQGAALLFPDLILSQSYNSYSLAPPPGKALKPGLNAVEDLSTRTGVQAFHFRHSPDSKRFIRSYAARLFADRDGLQEMLVAFLNGFLPKILFMTERGVRSLPSQ